MIMIMVMNMVIMMMKIVSKSQLFNDGASQNGRGSSSSLTSSLASSLLELAFGLRRSWDNREGKKGMAWLDVLLR